MKFLGNYLTSLDTEKGRTALPSTFRKKLGGKAIITKGYEGSLLVIDLNDWETVMAQVANQNFLSADSRQTERFLLGNAFEISFDAQGRFVLPTTLREYAKLDKEILFVGIGNRIEIWSKAAWEKNDQYLNENIAQLSEKLNDREYRK